MAKQLNEFLQEYFKLFRMVDMRDNHTEQWAHLLDVAKSGDMTKDQRGWVKDLLHKEPTGLQVNDLPKKTDLTDADWETLFRICQNVYARMTQNRYSYPSDGPVVKFLNEWDHVFTGTETASQIATPATESQCDDLAKLLEDNEKYFQAKLEHDRDWAGILDSSTHSYQDLIKGLKSKKYNKNDKFREKIQNLAGKIANAYATDNNFTQRVVFQRTPTSKPSKPNFDLIYNIYAPGWTQPNLDATKLNDFKTQYHSLFRTLYKDNKVLDAFKAQESGDNRISTAVENAKNGIDYDKTDSKNYLTPKRDDALTPMQQVQKWARETYEDCLEKYTTLSGDRLFFSEQAKKIAKALDKAGIRPTDGIAGLCSGDKISKAAAALKSSPTANEQFDWMTKTLKSFVDDPNMKKTIAGALKNGRQMHNLISELIIKAVEDNKINEAKTAMEVLSVMKYGSVTSRIMDAFKGQDFKLFSDGGLSWNKNEGIQFVSKALDKSIKFAFKTVGYGITIIGNEIRLSGSRFNKQFQHGDKDKAGAKLKALSTAHDTRVAAEERKFKADKRRADKADKAKLAGKRADRENALVDLFGTAPKRVSDGTARRVDKAEVEINSKLRPQLADAYADLQPWQDRLDTYEQIKSLLGNKQALEAELDSLNASMGGALGMAQQKAAEKRIELIASDIRKIDQELKRFNGTESPDGTGIMPDQWESKTGATIFDDIDAAILQLQSNPAYINASDNYDDIEQKINQREQAVKKFRSAQTEIENLSSAIDERKKQYTNWDKDHKNAYQELVAFWDMLESGRDSRTGSMYSWAPGSKKKKQQAFDANKQSIIDRYWSLTNQSYAA